MPEHSKPEAFAEITAVEPKSLNAAWALERGIVEWIWGAFSEPLPFGILLNTGIEPHLTPPCPVL